jgi:transcriptional regulator with XRE-family HTH domain
MYEKFTLIREKLKMNFNIGKTIKKLRVEKSVTQDELAKYLGITFQSVSKWETENASPDIGYLPQIAVFFGVSVDDLFSLNDINHFERVDKILDDGENMSESNFLYAKRYLTGLLEENDENIEALKRLIRLYEVRMDNFNLVAARFAEQAISLSPNDHELHNKLARFRGIEFAHEPVSWRMFRFYNDFVNKHPHNNKALANLHRAYVQTSKYKEAEDILKKISDEKIRALLKVDMLIRLGKSQEAFNTLHEHVNNFPNDPEVLFEAAHRHDKADHFETALDLYEKSFAAMPEPKFLQSLYHRGFMYDRFGYYEKAIEMWEEILVRQERDYNGEDMQWPVEMIVGLKNKIAKQRADCPAPNHPR